MFRNLYRQFSCLGLLFLVFGQLSTSGAEPLRYQWKPGQKFGYEVTITADLNTKVDTYQGSLLYEIKGVDGETVTLSYEGGVTGSAKKKGSDEAAKVEAYNAESFRGLKQTKSDLVLSTRGKVVDMKGDSQLPYMLGNLSILVFEAVPETESAGWSVEGGVGITEKNDGDRGPFGIPRGFGRPPSPFGRGGNQDTGKTTAATTTEQFKLKSETGKQAIYTKTYSLKSPGEETITLTGSGTWTFDRALGMASALNCAQQLSVTKGNVSVNTPVTVAYRLLSASERDKVVSDWAEIARKNKEAHDKFWAEQNQKKEEAKRFAETPLTPEETAAALAALKPLAAADAMRATLEKLKAKSLKNPDPAIVEAIRSHLKHSDKTIRLAAEDALAQWDPAFKKRYDVFVKYRGRGGTWEGSKRTVDAETKLVVGQVVLAKWQLMWDNAEILELLPDGLVHVSILGSPFKAKLTRDRIQLPHEEFEQPEEVQRRLGISASAPVMRTWTDTTGQFKIEAVLLSLNGDSVKLKRKDGREIELPLSKLSAEDQAIAKQPVKSEKPENPFE